jgi:Zn finger protein HypA/HybF involved in hydrogenase expression
MSKTNYFIEKARKKHGDRYDYSKSEFINSREKIKITCKDHGDFLQIPGNHTAGQGCFDCFYDKRRLTTEEFIKKAKKIHGDKYDYSKSVYKKHNKDKISIICKDHGEFMQAPTNHINGQRCPHCAFDIVSEKLKKRVVNGL